MSFDKFPFPTTADAAGCILYLEQQKGSRGHEVAEFVARQLERAGPEDSWRIFGLLDNYFPASYEHKDGRGPCARREEDAALDECVFRVALASVEKWETAPELARKAIDVLFAIKGKDFVADLWRNHPSLQIRNWAAEALVERAKFESDREETLRKDQANLQRQSRMLAETDRRGAAEAEKRKNSARRATKPIPATVPVRSPSNASSEEADRPSRDHSSWMAAGLTLLAMLAIGISGLILRRRARA